MTAQNFIMTLNNPTIGTEEHLLYMHNNCKAVYTVGQLERGEEGTIHIQYYMSFKNSIRPSAIKKYCKRSHIQVVKFNNGADRYCMKEDTRIEGPFEFGLKPVRRNVKTDWDEVWTKAATGNLLAIPAEIRIRSYSNLKRIEKDHIVIKDHTDLRGIWIYGPSGSGKSRMAREQYPDAYPKLCNKWWDGYQGQKNVIMDDIGLEHKCLAQQLKIWADRYGCILENKGGAMASNYEKFVITSQYTIDDIFEDEKTREALHRRFKCIKKETNNLFSINSFN